jgi:hypothetical protein
VLDIGGFVGIGLDLRLGGVFGHSRIMTSPRAHKKSGRISSTARLRRFQEILLSAVVLFRVSRLCRRWVSRAVAGLDHPLRSCGSLSALSYAPGVWRAHWLARTTRPRFGARLATLSSTPGASPLPLHRRPCARFSAGRQPSSPAGRVTATIDSLVRTTLVRFRDRSLQRSPVAPCRPRVAIPGPSRFGVFRHSGTHRPGTRPCGFSTPRACASFHSHGRRRRAGHSSPVSFQR